MTVEGSSFGPRLEHEELRFHARVHRVAELGGARAIIFLSTPRGSPAKGLPSGVLMSQISLRDAALCVSPRKDLKRAQVGSEQHVGLFDPDESFDRGSVEHDVAGQRLLELRRRDLDVLVDAEDVRELQSQEPDVVGGGEIQDILGASARGIGNLGAMSRHGLGT